MKEKTAKGALEGIRILDMTSTLAGPYCTMLLGDMGAEIIKIEVPGNGDDSRKYPPFIGTESAYFMNLNRNKKSLTLNLKTPEGKKIFLNLVKLSDVLVENFRPGTLEALGLAYDKLKTVNRDLVYSSIPGPGESVPGYDIIGHGMTGIMSMTSRSDGSHSGTGADVSEILTGLCACVGILSSLIAVGHSRRGQKVNVALIDSTIPAEHPIAGTIQLVGSPIHLSETPAQVRFPAPLLGQHSAEILKSVLNYSPEHIEALKREKVI